LQKHRSKEKVPTLNGQRQRFERTEADVAAITRDLQELEILGEIKSLARKHGVLLNAVLSSSRSQSIVIARDAIIDFLRSRFQYSSTETGGLLRMDHTTVQESMRRTKARKIEPPCLQVSRQKT
jgi:chromosomal replication initiation ATPase DnaA